MILQLSNQESSFIDRTDKTKTAPAAYETSVIVLCKRTAQIIEPQGQKQCSDIVEANKWIASKAEDEKTLTGLAQDKDIYLVTEHWALQQSSRQRTSTVMSAGHFS